MAATSEARALPFFTDLYGQPLESGSIYIGKPGLDPVAYPAVVTSDLAGSVVVAQPIKTTHGHATAAGALIHLFVAIPYSITILDAAGRVVYASLNESDPIATAVSTSSVQSAATLADLRARDKNSTNQVWVNDYGLYFYLPTDNTSPESLPFVVVGNDGARYHLSAQYLAANWMRAVAAAPSSSSGTWISWNDGIDNVSYITNNSPAAGSGGVALRNVSSDGLTETARAQLKGNGVFQTSSDINATGAVISTAGLLGVVSDGSRALSWDAVNGRYNMPAAPLFVNGSQAVTQATIQATLAANQVAFGVGSVALGTNAATVPVLPGTWVQTGSVSNSVYLYVRTA
jgi:hypothetical protein